MHKHLFFSNRSLTLDAITSCIMQNEVINIDQIG